MLPEDWKKRSVAEVCRSVSVGVVIKPSQYYVSASEGIKAFRSANVKEGQVNNSDWVYFSHKGHNENKKSELKTGDVLVVRTGYPGTACVVTPQYAGCNAIDVVIARPDIQKIIPTYLCLFTNSEYGKSQVANLQGGMAQKHLNVGAYQQVEIPLPPLPEQKKIAAILSTWDRAIDGTEKLLANSQQQKKALMQQLLTGKKRLPGFTGEWKSSTLAACCKPQQWATISSKDLTFSGFPVYGANGFIGYFSEYNHENDTVAVTCRGSTCGTVSLIKGPSYITGNSMCLDQVKKDCSHIYLYYYLNHRGLKDIISGSAQPQIVGKAIQKVSVQLPTLPEQKAIASALTTADEEITALESDLSRLRQEKKALMQQLLTGKRRVTVD
ncbi:restriction endonuclease subunit S [Gluconobacter oxydans]|uniref:Type I restriction modification DNA specificity domain-containing protein n=1 Tax=Gluconobacter oxydans TaxID=442 RepID=A0A149RWJ0_GLUOY|nr:restriction endonuclease subunit S [Gluconobacter oxydans]KXV18831.1 hypothetical protein AD934_06915 [Gluconobacter oxydans]